MERSYQIFVDFNGVFWNLILFTTNIKNKLKMCPAQKKLLRKVPCTNNKGVSKSKTAMS